MQLLNKGLADALIALLGANTVLMPFGGKFQKTPTQGMVANYLYQNGETTTQAS